ncbi:hypothetical protein B5S31_g3840 [[Candida] boidinii]|nr:hypothetical protein B5S31_g3840 [[Candida] boidinii]
MFWPTNLTHIKSLPVVKDPNESIKKFNKNQPVQQQDQDQDQQKQEQTQPETENENETEIETAGQGEDQLNTSESLPQVQSNTLANSSLTFERDPHLDPIIDSCGNETKLPFTIVTYRSVYLFDSITHAPLSCHIRSNESIREFGENKRIRISNNGKRFAVQTEKNYIFIFTISNEISKNKDEVLTVFSKDGKILQNGLPIYTNNNKSNLDKSVKSFFNVLFSSDDNEKPNYDPSFRLKLLLKVHNGLMDFTFIENGNLILFNDSPHSIQLIKLKFNNNNNNNNNNSLQSDESDEDKIILIEDLKWYSDVDKDSKITSVTYNASIESFLWVNELGNCWLVKKNDIEFLNQVHNDTEHSHPDDNKFNQQFVGFKIYESDKSDLNSFAEKIIINEFNNIITIATKNGDIFIYKLNKNFTCNRIRIIKKHIHSINLKSLMLSKKNDSIITIYENGWNIYSIMGNLSFSTFDYDQILIKEFDWFNNIINLNFINDFEISLISHKKIFIFSILWLNHSISMNAVTLKRPILYTNDRFHLFKGYDKSLIDHHYSNAKKEIVTNKETHLWASKMLPISFRLKNNRIKCISSSDDGQHVCVVGDRDVYIYSFIHDEWKRLLNSASSHDWNKSITADDESSNIVVSCLWWRNHLILASRTKSVENAYIESINNLGGEFQHGSSNLRGNNRTGINDNELCKSEVVAFSTSILNQDEEFSYDKLIWGFNFEETKMNENFLMFNIDLFTDELLVVTDKLNCYTWKLSLAKQQQQQQRQQQNGNSNDTSDIVSELNSDKKSNANNKDYQKLSNVSTNSKGLNSNISNNRYTLSFRKSTVFQLKGCFNKNLPGEADLIDLSILLNLKCIIKLNDTDILLLIDNTLLYINKQISIQSTKSIYHQFVLHNGIEYITKSSNNIINIFNGSKMLQYDLTNEKNLTKIIPVQINSSSESNMGFTKKTDYNLYSYKSDKVNNNLCITIDPNGTSAYPITILSAKNTIFGIETDISNYNVHSNLTNSYSLNNNDDGMNKNDGNDTSGASTSLVASSSASSSSLLQNFKVQTIKKNYLSSLIDYYIKYNIEAERKLTSEIGDVLSMATIFKRFHKYKHFKFCLELLLLNEIVDEDGDIDGDSAGKEDDKIDSYFGKLVELISMTNAQYSIYLNFLKKIEIQYWSIFFKKLNTDPRTMLNTIMDSGLDYKISAHFFIIMLNYEKEENSRSNEINKAKTKNGKKGKKTNGNTTTDQISKEDQDLMFHILVKLININKDYDTAFELIRFIKIVDDNLCKTVTKKLNEKLSN